MEKRVAFITGGASGIGFEIARQLGRAKIDVVIGARGRKAEGAAAALASEGIIAEGLAFDLTSARDRDRAKEHFQDRYQRLDILINNAGVWMETPSASDDQNAVTSAIDELTLRATFETNFFATVLLTHTLLPLLRASPSGRIVHLSSIHASLTLHSDPNSIIYPHKVFGYAAAKTALNAHVVQLAYELRGTTTKINAIHPGWVRTKMGGANALVEPADAARSVVELALLDDDGQSGTFSSDGEIMAW